MRAKIETPHTRRLLRTIVLRRFRGSQAAFSRACGLDVADTSRVLTGVRPVTLEIVARVAKSITHASAARLAEAFFSDLIAAFPSGAPSSSARNRLRHGPLKEELALENSIARDAAEMELRQLRYFKGVAELLNFSRAAEELHVAQSALSRQIQGLEHEVGTKLLDRDRSHVALTDAGKAFYASTCKLLLHLDVAVTEARQISRGATGELVICTDWRVNAHFVSGAIEEFRRHHRRVEIAVRDTGFKAQIAMLRSGEAHVGFIAREYVGKQGELQFLPIQRVYINAIVAAGHPFAGRKRVRLSDLAKERWVDLTEKEAASFRTYFFQQCRLSGFVPRWSRAADTLDGLFGYVASGYGITASPDHVRPRSGLPLSLIRTDCSPIEFGVVWSRENPSPLIEQFIGIIRRRIASLPQSTAEGSRPDSGTA